MPAPKKAGEDQAIGRSRGGLSTKIHALVDALDNPVAFSLSGGQAHDLVGADDLLPNMQADLLIADKAYDADERVISMLADRQKAVVIPPKVNRTIKRDYNRHVYKTRHLGSRLIISTTRPRPRDRLMRRNLRPVGHSVLRYV